MSPHTNYRRKVRPQRGPTSALWLGMLSLLIVAGGVALALMKAAKKQQAGAPAEQREAPRPFEDLPEEQPPVSFGGGGGQPDTSQPFAEGRAVEATREAIWLEAQALAAAADPFYRAAVEAKAAQDVSTMNEKGRAARFKLNEALESTATWEAALIERYGETDPAVREIMRTRSGWFDRLQWLSKSIAR